MLPADACALAQEFTPPALVPAPRRADLGSDGFIAAAISPSAPALPNSPNPLSRSVPGRGTEADCLLGCAGRDASVSGCVFTLKPWGHLRALPSTLSPPPPRNFEAWRVSTPRVGAGSGRGWGGGRGRGREIGPDRLGPAHLAARGRAGAGSGPPHPPTRFRTLPAR